MPGSSNNVNGTIEFYQKALPHPAQQQAREEIANLLEEVRRCWTPADYHIAHQHLQRLAKGLNQVIA